MKKAVKKNFTKKFNLFWRLLGGVILLVTFWFTIKSCFKSDERKFNDENVISNKVNSPKLSNYSFLEQPLNFNIKGYEMNPAVKGIHIPDLSKKDMILIEIGGHVFIVPTINLYQGIDILHPFYSNCIPNILGIVAKNDKLYVSAKFIDFETEDEIGEIEFNHWKIYKGTFLDYHQSNNKFEVIDHKGNIVFSIDYPENNSMPFVYISGYFISPSSIAIFNNEEVFSSGHKYVDDHNNECILKSNSNWKQLVKIEMKKTKSIF